MKRRGTIDEERKKPETMKMLIKKIAVVARGAYRTACNVNCP